MAFDESGIPFAKNRTACLTGNLFAGLLQAWAASWQKHIQGLEGIDAMIERGERTLILFWHGKYLPLFPLMKQKKACVLTNSSFRGRVIGQVCRRFGYHSVHLPEKPEKRYLFTLRRALADHPLWGTAADGPTGPWHHIKPSTLELASRFNFTLLPLGVAANHCWQSKSRWDRMEMPWPFSRIALVIGQPLRLPENLDPVSSPPWVEHLRESLDRCHEEAERLIGKKHDKKG